MNSQKLLIISVLAALLILGGAVAFVKFKPEAPSTAASITKDTEIVIQDALTACTDKQQCIVVDTTCSFCCKYVAINAQSEALFNQMFDQTCKQYNQSYCECHDLSSYPSCVNGKCQMVKWSENKPLKVPPAPVVAPVVTPTAEPMVTPTPQPPVTAPVPEEIAPVPVPDDLYAPLPSANPLQTDIDAVEVIQP